MNRKALLLIPAISLFVFPAFIQKRTKNKAKPGYETLVQASLKQFKSGSYAKALTSLREATAIVASKFRVALREALPEAPEDFTRKVQKDRGNMNNALAAALSASVGTSVEARYTSKTDRKLSLTVKVTASSPMVVALRSMFGFAKMQKDVEVIEYEKGDKGIFKKTRGGKRFELQILSGERDLVEFFAENWSEDAFFSFASQKNLNRLRTALGH